MTQFGKKKFRDEEKFRGWLLKELECKIHRERLNFRVLKSKNVNDILFCKESESLPVLVFIEVKLYQKSHGRIGVGGNKGQGFQPEILLERPIYFDRYLRWVLCNNENKKCVFANNEIISKYCEITKGQQNNISLSIFEKEETVDILDVADKVVEWLKTI